MYRPDVVDVVVILFVDVDVIDVVVGDGGAAARPATVPLEGEVAAAAEIGERITFNIF